MLHSNSFLTFIPNWQPLKISIIFLFLGITTSCEDPATDIGADLLQSGDVISTNFTDSLTIKTSTVLMDSVITSATDKLLVGRYTDPVFGAITAKTFFQIANVDSLKTNENTVLDSVVLNLGYKYFIGDTLMPQSFTVHRVLEKIGQNTGSLTKRLLESLESKNTYFNTDKLKYDPMPLGSTGTFKARPIVKKRLADNLLDSMRTLKVKLNDTFGKELMSLSGKPAGSGLVNFKEYFKGMVLVPGANENAAILGFEPNNTPASVKIKPSFIGLYYHTKDKKDTLRTFFFVSFTSNEAFNNRFNNLEFNRNSSVVANLKKPNDFIEAVGQNKEAYVQSSAGIATKIEFPSLKNLSKNGNIAINKVELFLKPTNLIEGTFPTIGLNLILPNPKNNKIPFRTATGDLSALPAENTATAQLAIYNATRQEYSFNITSYVQQVLLGNIENNGLFIASAADNRLNRLILNKNSIKLRVFYSKLGK
jgi:hypothetical protein